MKNSTLSVPFKKNVLFAAVCLGLVTMASSAQAVVLNAEATINLQTYGAPYTEGDTNSVYASMGLYDADASGASYAAGRGNDNGWMYSYAGGEGYFDSQGRIQQTVEFTNDSGVAQNYSFDFTINFGSLSAYNYEPLTGGDFVRSGNNVAIRLDGVDLFTSEAELMNNDSGTTLSTDGVLLGSYASGSNSYSWGEYTGVLDLGVFNPGESFFLEYDIVTFSSGNVAAAGSCSDGEWGGDGFGEEFGYGCYYPTYGYSQFGDPNGISGMPISNTTVTSSAVHAVPEPGLLLLLCGGVAGLAFSGRKRARKS